MPKLQTLEIHDLVEPGLTLTVTWAGMDWIIDKRRVLVNPKLKFLILSDIHIGYYSSLRAQGSYLPDYDSKLLQDTIDSLVIDYTNYHWIIAGDIKHRHSKNLSKEEKDEVKNVFSAITEKNKLTVILGNHDKDLENVFEELAITCNPLENFYLNGVIITHNQDLLDKKLEEHYIIGHFHPIISMEHVNGSFIPVFAMTDNLIILPAFNYVAGGFNIKNLFYRNEKRQNFSVFAIGKQIYDLGTLQNLI